MSTYLYFIFLGFAPALFWLWILYRKDRWEPEPKQKVIKIFLFGILAIFPVGILESYLQESVFKVNMTMMMQSLWFNALICFVIIGPVEELGKYLVVKTTIYRDREFNERIDGVIYMVAAAMGFSGLENLMYIWGVGMRDPSQATYLGIMRGILSTPAHAIFSGFLGLYLGKAKFCESKLKSFAFLIWGLIVAIFLHGLYDFLVFAGSPYFLGIFPLLIISGLILLHKVHELAEQSPFKQKDPKSVQV